MNAPASGLRIGDAERSAAADRLAWHFGRGRLDQAELDERLGLAMRATTAGDLTGLFADLPADEPEPAAATASQPALPEPRRPRRPRARRLGGLETVALAACIIVVASVVLHALTQSIAGLAVLLLIVVLWLRRRRVRS